VWSLVAGPWLPAIEPGMLGLGQQPKIFGIYLSSEMASDEKPEATSQQQV